MLKSLGITNLAVIANMNIEFDTGLSILTGETGAGKSIIIDAINLILGERASKEIIRTGEQKTRVEALFTIDESIKETVNNLGIECDDELLISREISADGKNSVRINGCLSTIVMLKTVGELLVNIHGQHDNQALLNPQKHLHILDDYADDTALLKSEYSKCFEKVRTLNEELLSLSKGVSEREHRIEILTYEIKLIEKAAIKKGELNELIELRKIMSNSRKIAENAGMAYQEIVESYEKSSAGELIGSAMKKIEEIASCSDKLGGIYDSLSQIYYSLEDVGHELAKIQEEMDFDEQKIDETEKRIDELNDLRRRFGGDYDQIMSYYERVCHELDYLTHTEENTQKINQQLIEAKNELKMRGETLSQARRKAAKTLEKTIINELADLNMPNAVFKAEFTPTDKFYKDGIDKVEFMISVNAGIEPGKLSKIASGGELSRIMLCLSSALMGKYNIPTMIYDEIDTGVSGRAAQKIAEKLWRVSCDRQVLSVTHLPQIAAMADNHYLIEKEIVDSSARTKVIMLDKDERIREIARITGGVEITAATLKSAEEMLKQSDELKKKGKRK